jgi:hypothetical protein
MNNIPIGGRSLEPQSHPIDMVILIILIIIIMGKI